MAVYFSGTSTKEKYEVGREYVNSRGQVVTANTDGSFGNRETGQVMRGSSYNPDVAWYADGADAALWGAYHNSPTGQVAFYTDQGKAVYENKAPNPSYGGLGNAAQQPERRAVGAGLAGTVFGGGAARINGPVVSLGNRGAFLRDNAWSGKDDPGQDMLWGGFHYMANPRWTNMELLEARLGDSELISTALGLATLGADLGYSARNWADRNGFNNGRGPAEAIARGVQPDVVGDAINAGRNALTSWANQNKAHEQRLQAHEDDFNEAWDYRMELTQREGMKAGDWTAIPEVVSQAAKREAQAEAAKHSWINPSWGRGPEWPGRSGGW